MRISRKLLVAGASLCMFYSGPNFAQDDGFNLLEEIIVTARKREESLQEVPVSISVLSDNLIEETGILTQEELFQLVPGIYYDQGPDRNAAFPSVRGVQSNEIATNRTKVTAFVDGMPILGSQGSLGFGNLAQVEVYRGPQSAAFGRSTFGGAINYVTRDPGDTFEGDVRADVNGYGRRLLRGGVSGPLSETVGFMVNAEYEDSTAPDEYLASDGTQYGERSTESIAGKLVLNPSDNLEIELTYSNIVTFDTPGVSYYISEEARDACYAQNGIVAVTGMGGTSLYADGTFDCPNWSQSAPVFAQNDRSVVLAQAFDNPAYARQFPQYQGLTQQQQDDLLFLAQSQSVFGDYFSAHDERDRISIQADYLTDNGHAFQFTAFSSEEAYIRGADNSRDPDTPINIVAPMAMGPPMGPPMGPLPPWEVVGMGPAATIGTIMSDPTDISETYAEVRWVSPDENRLRYVVGASYYNYDFLTSLYFGGYDAVARGPEAVQRYIDLTGDDPSIPDQLLGESASNTGIFFNATYDVTDRLAVTAEGRYQNDEVSGTDTISRMSGSVLTKAFVPRLSFNYNVSDSTSFYGQFARGNNPAGVNVGFFNPAIRATLDRANALWEETNGAEGVPYTVENVVNFDEEQLTNLEFGLKGSALDGRLQYATAIYFMEWEGNVQPINLYWGDPNLPRRQQDPNESNRTFLNNGDLEMKGAEFEGNFFVTDNFSVRAALGLLDTHYTNFCDVTIAAMGGLGAYAVATGRSVVQETGGRWASCYRVDGQEQREQPKVTGSLSPSYRGILGDSGLRWNARADVRFETDQWLDSANIAKTPAITTVNVSAGLNGENWGATLYVNNLTDDDTPRRIAAGEDITINPLSAGSLRIASDGADATRNYRVTPRPPRTVGVRLNYNF